MAVVFCAVCPHPPIVVPEVGGTRSKEVSATQEALLKIGRRVKESGADALVIISPHGPVFRDAIAFNWSPRLRGDLGHFGAKGVQFDLSGAPELAVGIAARAEKEGLSVVRLAPETARQYDVDLRLDHGVTVPLYFLRQAGVNLPLVHVAMSMDPVEDLYRFGQAVRDAATALGRKVALLASGDLSHCLTHDAPGGYHPRGKEFDREVARLLAGADFAGYLALDRKLVSHAGECGYRSIAMMLGALEGLDVKAEVLSYECPFGVGYLVAAFTPGAPNPERELAGKLKRKRQGAIAERRDGEHYLVRLARETLESYVRSGHMHRALDVPPEFQGKAGAFVSIKKHGELRGCIGTVGPTQESIAEEVVANAVSAGTRDPRFYPVQEEELGDLVYSVDVLLPPEPAGGLADLDPKKYGVIVKSGRRQGLLLPNLEGIDTAEEQVSIARQKAGIAPNEPVELDRFEVIRYK